MLFFEPLLSGSGKTSCATCHNPALSWADGLPKAVGDKAKPLARRSPTLLNIAWLSILGWDGGFPGIEQMTFVPITGKNNMSLDEATAIKRLAARSSYVDAFRAAYSDGTITRARIENAIATYERTLVSGEAPFDRWISGDERAIDKAAKRGFVLFTGQAGCANCHSGWAFTDGSFADVGVGKEGDLGRAAWFPTSVKLQHAFKTPTLRDVARRGPYMHDGSLPSLAAVIDLYDRGGINRPSRAPEIKPLGLSPQQKSDLIAFLNTLTSATKAVSVPVLPR
jgi:cytochrome c peroxidase